MTKNSNKFTAEKKYFLIKNCNLSLGLHKGRPSYSITLSKENIQHFKTWFFFTFFALLDQDPQTWRSRVTKMGKITLTLTAILVACLNYLHIRRLIPCLVCGILELGKDWRRCLDLKSWDVRKVPYYGKKRNTYQRSASVVHMEYRQVIESGIRIRIQAFCWIGFRARIV